MGYYKVCFYRFFVFQFVLDFRSAILVSFDFGFALAQFFLVQDFIECVHRKVIDISISSFLQTLQQLFFDGLVDLRRD